jgi:hypothetical protein
VQGLPSDVEALAAGAYHNLAVTADGRLWAWGRNAEGQLGPRAGVDHTPAAEVARDPHPPPHPAPAQPLLLLHLTGSSRSFQTSLR